MIDWLGVGHLFELSRTEAVLGFFTTLAVFAAFFLAQLVLLDAGHRSVVGAMRSCLSRTVFKGEFEPPIFTLDLARKDIGLATDMARRNDVPMPVANVVEQVMMQAMNRGWSEKDRTVAVLLQEETSGVEMRTAREW